MTVTELEPILRVSSVEVVYIAPEHITNGQGLMKKWTKPLSFWTPTAAIQMLQLDHLLPTGYTVDQIISAQGDDANLELLLKFLKTEEEPTEYFLMLASAEIKAYWLNKEQFIMKDDVLFYI